MWRDIEKIMDTGTLYAYKDAVAKKVAEEIWKDLSARIGFSDLCSEIRMLTQEEIKEEWKRIASKAMENC